MSDKDPLAMYESQIQGTLEMMADSYQVDRERFVASVRPTIRSYEPGPGGPRIVAVPKFWNIFDLLPADQALCLFEIFALDELEGRIQLIDEMSGPFSTFYDLSDWSTCLTAFMDFQTSNTSSLIQTGYSRSQFSVSAWMNREFGSLYPVKYKYEDVPGGPWFKKSDNQLRIDGKGTIGPGAPCDYQDADYLPVFCLEDAQRLDSSELRKKAMTLRRDVFQSLIQQLDKRKPGRMSLDEAREITYDCLVQGMSYIARQEIQLLRQQDLAYADLESSLCAYNYPERHVRAGGVMSLINLIASVLSELVLRSNSNLRARLHSFAKSPPEIGIGPHLKQAALSDYARGRGDWFEELYLAYRDQENNRPQIQSAILTVAKDAFAAYSDTPMTAAKCERWSKFCIHESDFSVTYRGKKYELRDRYWKIVCFLAKEAKKGNHLVGKQAILQHCKQDERVGKTRSIKRLFKDGGGDPEKYVEDGLLISKNNGSCGLNVSPDDIYFMPAPDDSK